MMKIALVGLVCLFVPSLGFADAFAINVLSTQYTTFVSAEYVSYPSGAGDPVTTETARTTVSRDPILDAIRIETESPATRDWARAEADLFRLSVATASGSLRPLYDFPFADASAETALTFSPLEDGHATIDVDFLADGSRPEFSDGFVRLFDVTADHLIWNYDWTYPLTGTVPWDRHVFPHIAMLTLEQEFSAAHVYLLTMSATTQSNRDTQFISIQLSGLEATPVPEPASLLLLATGLVGMGVRRWRNGISTP